MNLLHRIHQVEQAATVLFAKYSKLDITPRQGMVLRAVRTNPGCSQTALVAATNVDRSTLADIVRRLVKKGWITRKRSRIDARAYVVDLTESGRKILRAAEEAAVRTEKDLATEFPGVKHLLNGSA